MISLWDCQFGLAQFVRATTFQFSGHLSILTLKVSILIIDTFNVKINTFKIKIEKCSENEKMSKLLHAQIRLAQIYNLIMKLSRPRPGGILKLLWCLANLNVSCWLFFRKHSIRQLKNQLFEGFTKYFFWIIWFTKKSKVEKKKLKKVVVKRISYVKIGP